MVSYYKVQSKPGARIKRPILSSPPFIMRLARPKRSLLLSALRVRVPNQIIITMSLEHFQLNVRVSLSPR